MRRLTVFTPKMLMILHAAELVTTAATPYIKRGRCLGGENRGRAVVGNRRKSAQ